MCEEVKVSGKAVHVRAEQCLERLVRYADLAGLPFQISRTNALALCPVLAIAMENMRYRMSGSPAAFSM